MQDKNKTKQQLLSELAELRQRVAEMEALGARHKQAEKEQRELREALGERVRELNCLYSIAGLIEKADSLEEILRGTVDLMPHGWRYPEVACARIVFGDQEFRTKNFQETAWKQSGDIVARGKRAGMVDLCYLEERPNSDEGPFSEEERKLLNAIAARLGRSTERMWAEAVLARHDQEMAALYATSLEINSQPDVSALLHAIVRRAVGLLETRMGGLYLMRPDGQTLELVVCHNLPRDYTGSILHLGEGLAGRAAQTGEPVMVSDYLAWEGRMAVYADGSFRRVLGVPLRMGNRTIGVITVQDEQVGPFDEDQVRLVSLFADQATIAVENARPVEVLQQRNRDLDLLVRVGQTLSATLDPQEVTARLMQALLQAVGVEGSSVWLWDEEQPGELVCRGAVYPGLKESLIGWRLGPGEGVATWVAQHGQSVIVPSVSNDPRFSPRIDLQIGFRTASLLVVPLRVRDQVIGVLEVVNKHDGEFDAHDRFLVETLAPSAAIAIENARLVENLRQQTAELQTRNEELDTFAHTVAHDLKNPVGLIMGYAEVLVQDYAAMSDEQRKRFLQTVARNGRKMKSIIEELLLLAQVRKMQVEREPLDMAVIVFEAQQRLADMIKECRAEIVLPAEWPIALGYAPWVEEVWVNYLSNAIKYGGLPPRLELGAAAESGGMVRFWVHDNGPGLAPEAEAQLFVPFTRLDQIRVKGHGLGLSIVRRIVEKLGGRVGEESQPGQGSTFFFTLHAASGRST